MRSVILAGGLGTRLRPLTFSIPKPLLPVGEKPILELILLRLKSFGFQDFILSIGYKGELIETYFQTGEKFGVQIRYAREAEPCGTAGPLSLVARLFPFSPGESFLLMNGDILTELDFHRFIEFHESQGFEMTVGVKEIERQLPYGVLEISDGRVLGIVEKPATRYPISAGIYLLRESVLSAIPPDTFFTIPDLIHRLVAESRPVGSYPIEEYWLALEHQDDMEAARSHLKEWP